MRVPPPGLGQLLGENSLQSFSPSHPSFSLQPGCFFQPLCHHLDPHHCNYVGNHMNGDQLMVTVFTWEWKNGGKLLLSSLLFITIVLIIFTRILINDDLRYNREPGPGLRQMFASFTLLASCLYRATILSIMVKISILPMALIRQKNLVLLPSSSRHTQCRIKISKTS